MGTRCSVDTKELARLPQCLRDLIFEYARCEETDIDTLFIAYFDAKMDHYPVRTHAAGRAVFSWIRKKRYSYRDMAAAIDLTTSAFNSWWYSPCLKDEWILERINQPYTAVLLQEYELAEDDDPLP